LPRQVFLFDQAQRRRSVSDLRPTYSRIFCETQFVVAAAGSEFMFFWVYKYVDDGTIRWQVGDTAAARRLGFVEKMEKTCRSIMSR
jgi:hypothetical protein